MCPRFLPNDMSEDGRYYLHEGLTNPDVTLELTANNLVAPVSRQYKVYIYCFELGSCDHLYTMSYITIYNYIIECLRHSFTMST